MGQDWPTDCNVLTPAIHHVSKLLLKIFMTVCLISAPRYSSFCYCDKMLHVDSLMEEEFILDLDSEVWVHLGVDREVVEQFTHSQEAEENVYGTSLFLLCL